MVRAVTYVVSLLAVASNPVFVLGQTSLPEEVQAFVRVDAPVVALANVTVVDGTGAEPANDQTIVIVEGRIALVGPASDVAIPDGAEVLDLSGHTVIPGIVGMHNHTFYTTSGRRVQLTESAPRLYLAVA
ncbi:MAG: hypothetical protein P8Y29_04995 [Gemmatimonadota bacterium]